MKNQILKMCAILGIAGMLAGCGTTVGGNGESKEALKINVTDMANELKNRFFVRVRYKCGAYLLWD